MTANFERELGFEPLGDLRLRSVPAALAGCASGLEPSRLDLAVARAQFLAAVRAESLKRPRAS